MEAMTIGEVSKTFAVSARMIRYYEKIGLIESHRRKEYAYRIYDETAVRRLRQIMILRKLRISLKQIGVILNDIGQTQALEVLRENMTGLDEEIHALNTIRSILDTFVHRLDDGIRAKVRVDLLEDSELIEIADALISPKNHLKEDCSMEELNQASERMERNMDIRFIYLPPATVAASQFTGENPEDVSGDRVKALIKERDLPVVKPDFRLYGFNNPSPQEGEEYYGYEFWVTIPEDMEVTEPLEKKQFAGGLYAAHCIKMGDFHEWGAFFEQMKNHEDYEIQWREPFGMGGALEEHLNAFSFYTGNESDFIQLDLLIPVKKKSDKETNTPLQRHQDI